MIKAANDHASEIGLVLSVQTRNKPDPGMIVPKEEVKALLDGNPEGTMPCAD